MAAPIEAAVTAKTLKSEIWAALKSTKSGELEAGSALAIARHAREIVNITRVQLEAARQSGRNVPTDVLGFTEG